MKKDLQTNKKSEVKQKLNSKGDTRGISKASLNNLNGIHKKAGPGRPKGKLNYDTRIDYAIEVLSQKYIDDMNKKNKKVKGYIPLTLDDVDLEGDIYMQAFNKARNGNEKMMIDFFDRRQGKATQKVELTGKDGGSIEYTMKLKEAEERIKKFQDKWFKNKK